MKKFLTLGFVIIFSFFFLILSLGLFNTPTASASTTAPTTSSDAYSQIIDPNSQIHSAFRSLLNLPYTLLNNFNSNTGTGQTSSTTLFPTPTPSSTSSLSVSGLVSAIGQNCHDAEASQITIRNFTCLNSITPPLPPTTTRLLDEFSVFGWDHIQCVGFVRAVSSLVSNETGEELCDRSSNGGSAIGCARDSIYYHFVNNYDGTTIKVGDYPIWRCSSINPYGHIAYVTDVYNDSYVRVAEANWQPGVVDERNINITHSPVSTNPSQCTVIGWLTKKI